MLYVYFESTLNPVGEQYIMKMKQTKTEQKSKALYTGKINTRVPSGWCVASTFAYRRDIHDALEMYCVKNCVEKFKQGTMKMR